MSIFSAFSRGIRVAQEFGIRQAQVDRLNAMSDRELADVGVPRDRITHHVYRDIMGQ